MSTELVISSPCPSQVHVNLYRIREVSIKFWGYLRPRANDWSVGDAWGPSEATKHLSHMHRTEKENDNPFKIPAGCERLIRNKNKFLSNYLDGYLRGSSRIF